MNMQGRLAEHLTQQTGYGAWKGAFSSPLILNFGDGDICDRRHAYFMKGSLQLIEQPYGRSLT
jgi:hypothetical protein